MRIDAQVHIPVHPPYICVYVAAGVKELRLWRLEEGGWRYGVWSAAKSRSASGLGNPTTTPSRRFHIPSPFPPNKTTTD
jgi:hypothetical protein